MLFREKKDLLYFVFWAVTGTVPVFPVIVSGRSNTLFMSSAKFVIKITVTLLATHPVPNIVPDIDLPLLIQLVHTLLDYPGNLSFNKKERRSRVSQG